MDLTGASNARRTLWEDRGGLSLRVFTFLQPKAATRPF